MNGLAVNPSSRMDSKVAPVFRSILFAPTIPGLPAAAFDLVAADIARGRDHGLVSYSEARVFLGWSPIQTMEDITLNTKLNTILGKLYRNTTSNVDLYVGMLTEDTLVGGAFGPVTTSVIREQFLRTRDGDRCWFERLYSGNLLQVFRKTRLRDLVDRNFQSTGPSSLFTTQSFDESPSSNVVERNGLQLFLDPHPDFQSSTFNVSNGASSTPTTTDGGNATDSLDDLFSMEDLYVDLVADTPANATVVPLHVNSRRTRPATVLDNIVGYTCSGRRCEAYASVDEPDVSHHPHIFTLASYLRHALRTTDTGFNSTASPADGETVVAAPAQVTTLAHPTHRVNCSSCHDPLHYTSGVGFTYGGADGADGEVATPVQVTTLGYSAQGGGCEGCHIGAQHTYTAFTNPTQHACSCSSQHHYSTFNTNPEPAGRVNESSADGGSGAVESAAHGDQVSGSETGRWMETFQSTNAFGTRTQQSPSPGVITSTVRASLADVKSEVLVNNIFVTPSCRL
uniref:Peroxinectin A n=1 Tax=Lygus hesperus TaxID=30085 RepID=A0A0A9ZH72_LYGHE